MPDRERPTDEVGSEGGSAGNVERARQHGALRGSEATTTVDHQIRRETTVARDETDSVGRRSPIAPGADDLE